MNISSMKATVAKVITAGLLAGVFVMAAPAKAEAQSVRFGIAVGYPQYSYPQYDNYHRDHYDHIRAEEFRRQEDARRHEEWARAHDYRGYRHDAPYGYR